MNTKPTEELVKELYARFGRAYYDSECLHRALCNFYAISPFVGPLGVTGPRLEERLTEAYSLTLGDVISRLKGVVPDELHIALTEANERRKFLAHHFWFEKCHLMFSLDGINGLIEQLNADSAFFFARDAETEAFARSRMKDLGVTDEMCQAALAQLQAGDPHDELMKRRKPKKRETIVHAWRIPSEGAGHVLILETEDGELWQFCEVGLGWSPYTLRGETWLSENAIEQHLPATVDPRPKNAKPWQFEFPLRNDKYLWVRMKTNPKCFVWGISGSSKPQR